MILEFSGKQVIVDDEDVARIQQYKWYVNEKNYVSTWDDNHFLLHRFVLNYTGPLQVDHINCNPLDNRKSNLRIVEPWVNYLNKIEPPTHNTSGMIGVHHNKNTGKYEAFVHINDWKKHLGHFDTVEEANHVRHLFVSKMLMDESLRKKPEIRANNKSGVVGVCFVQATKKWKVKKDGKHLGFFDKKEDAIAARRQADAGKL